MKPIKIIFFLTLLFIFGFIATNFILEFSFYPKKQRTVKHCLDIIHNGRSVSCTSTEITYFYQGWGFPLMYTGWECPSLPKDDLAYKNYAYCENLHNPSKLKTNIYIWLSSYLIAIFILLRLNRQ
jgi:hypothetical protein